MTVWTLGGIVAYAFTYTYVWNRTKSVFLCMLLHAVYNTALGVAILRPEGELVGSTYVTLSAALTGSLWLVALGLITATRGRLGLPATVEARRPSAPSNRRPVHPPATA